MSADRSGVVDDCWNPDIWPHAAPFPAGKLVRLGDRLRGIMSTVDQLEKTTGHGGWYAEHIQELCDAIARDAGLKSYREGFTA